MVDHARTTSTIHRQRGPVTRAIAAMRSEEPEPTRRLVLATVAAGIALVGEIIGMPRSRAAEVDMDAVAAGYIEDAHALGMCFIVGPDGDLWCTQSIKGTAETFAARDRLKDKLYQRRGLRDAVIRAAPKSPQRTL